MWLRNANRMGMLSTVDLLVLTSLDQLNFMLKILLTFVSKPATLMRRWTVLSLPLYLVFPALSVHFSGAEPIQQFGRRL